MYKQLNRISMKQLCEQLQNEFRDIVICTISPFSPSIHIVPSLDKDFFSQCDILMVSESLKVCTISIFLWKDSSPQI